MAKRVWLIAAFAAFAAAPAVRAETVVFKAALSGNAEAPPVVAAGSGSAEAPPVVAAGSGSATVNADLGTKQLSWQVAYTGLSGPPVGAHIHCGAPAGANAPIVLPLGARPNLASPIQGSGTITDSQIQQLRSGLCYVNIHTDQNRPGELRGQLAP